MASFNQVILVGNLTRDPELKYTPKGTAIAKIGLACNRTWTDDNGDKKEEVLFVDCDAFGKTAENIGQYMRKGSPILIQGRLKLDQWEDKQSGDKRSKITVSVGSVQFLGRKSDGDGDGGSDREDRPQRQSKPSGKTQGRKAEPADDADDNGGGGEDDDVPF